MKWTLCAQRSPDLSVPRATGAPPPSPRILNDCHIYAAWFGPEFEIESILSCLLIDLWNVLFCKKTDVKILLWELLNVSCRNVPPRFSSSTIKWEFVLCLLIRCLNFCLAGSWRRSCFLNENFEKTKIFLPHVKWCLGNTALTLPLRSEFWMGLTPPSYWRSFDSHRDTLTPTRRGRGFSHRRGGRSACMQSESLCVYGVNVCLSLLSVVAFLSQACAHRWKNVYYDSEHILPHGYCSIIPPTLQGRTKPLIPCYEGTVQAHVWTHISLSHSADTDTGKEKVRSWM